MGVYRGRAATREEDGSTVQVGMIGLGEERGAVASWRAVGCSTRWACTGGAAAWEEDGSTVLGVYRGRGHPGRGRIHGAGGSQRAGLGGRAAPAAAWLMELEGRRWHSGLMASLCC